MSKIKNSIVLFVTVFSIVGINGVASAQVRGYAPHFLKGSRHRVCDDTSSVQANCFAQVVADQRGTPLASTGPVGLGPVQLHGAYQLPTTSGDPATIAVVDAYDDPYITNDLATYDSTFGLPSFPSCSSTITSACFQKVNQNGGSFYPARSSSWALETSLDVETAHEICQNCKLILVEASSSSFNNLMAAVDRARLMGATVISNSYGASEFFGETTYDRHFNYPGIAFTFSSGDSGYGTSYPAASNLVTAVSGTTLSVSPSNVWLNESVWNGSGSGCSRYETKPVFQNDVGCSKRTIADVSADADPNSGAAVYDSYPYYGRAGWFQVGGTSLASPLIAGAYALAHNVNTSTFANSFPYSSLNYSLNIHDITAGSNGVCSVAYLCNAATGFDGPSGLGTPEGLAAF